MPIRLNLLAEAQALEDARRRNPVKRVIVVAALLTGLMLAWAGFLQFRILTANNEISRVQGNIDAKATKYKQVVENQKLVEEARTKLAALKNLSGSRFLNGNLLQTLQQTTIDDVQLVHLKVDQSYVRVDEVKPRTAGSKVIPGSPATVTEKIALVVDGRDSSASPGDQVAKFKGALATNAYFHDRLGAANQINLKNLSAPQIAPDTGRAVVLFTLEWRYPDKTR